MNSKRTGTDRVALGVLVALILSLGGWMDKRLDRFEDQMNTGFSEVREEIGAVRTEIGAVRTELYKVGQRVARIEGAIAGPAPLPTGKHTAPRGK